MLAASNLSFEIWLIMHLGDIGRLETQDDYEHELSRLLERRYEKAEGLKNRLTEESVRHAVGIGSKRLPDGSIVSSRKTANSSTVWKIVGKIIDDMMRFFSGP